MASISRVLITGGTGFIGYWLGRTQPPDLDVVTVNRFQYESARLEYMAMDAVIHLAPVSPARVLDYAKRRGIRVLFASSGAVYDGRLGQYAENKRKWEAECADSGADVVIARPFSFVGAHLSSRFCIANFIKRAKEGLPLSVWGDGSEVRSWLYAEDMGRWLWRILLDGSGVYDVGSSVEYTILEAARIVADIYPTRIDVLNNGVPAMRYVPDTRRAAALGCIETIGLREAIERTIHEG